MTSIEGAPAESTAPADPRRGEAAQRAGLGAALAAFLLWGFLPLLFHFLEHAGAVTIVADRTLWSLLLVGIIIVITGRAGEVRAALRDRRALLAMAASAALLAMNWLLYVWAVETGQVLEASFGYFINPLVNIALGMMLLGERQNRIQMIAIGIAVVAILIQSWGIGRVPYIALGLAITFALYGYIRKTAKASSTTGLFVETLLLAPIAFGYLAFSFATAGPGVHADPGSLLLLAMTGPATAVPLLLFAFGAQRLRLTTIGMLQYIGPSIQFVLAVTFFAEPLNGLRLLSFGLIWLSLAVFSADGFRRRGRG